MPEEHSPKSWSISQKGNQIPPSDQLDPLDLFANTAANEDGYARWRAEVEAERDAGHLPVNPNAAGYERWKAEMQQHRAAFEKRWGIRIGRRVRICLRGEPREREGILHLAEELTDSAVKSARRIPLRLRIGDFNFLPSQIESLSVID